VVVERSERKIRCRSIQGERLAPIALQFAENQGLGKRFELLQPLLGLGLLEFGYF
jgi:hypothetical protein